MRVKSEREVTQSCLTLSDPMDCSPPGSSIHAIFQARVLEWGAIAFSGHISNTVFFFWKGLWIELAFISQRAALLFTHSFVLWNSTIILLHFKIQ